MEVTRRTFSKILVTAAGFVPFAGVWQMLRWILPVRVVRAITKIRFPGRIRPLDHAKIMKQGKWSG